MKRYLEFVYRRWRRADDEAGMTLIEVLVAMFILTTAVVAIAAAAAQGLSVTRIARDRDAATAAASTQLEQMRSLPFDEVAHAATVPSSDPYIDGTVCSGAAFDSDDGGSAPAEAIHVSPGGAITDALRVQTQGRITVHTYITGYHDPDATTGACATDGKRITVIATWSDPTGGEREVRQSTVLAETGGRGGQLGAFALAPLCTNPLLTECTQAAGSDPAKMVQSPAPGQHACFAHTLQNYGDLDAYDMQILHGTSFDQYGNPEFDGLATFGALTVDGWTARAWLGEPRDDSKRLVQDPGRTQSPEPSPERLESPDDVEKFGEMLFVVCYEPPSNPSGTYNFRVDVRSESDTDESKQIEHEITVGAVSGAHYFLHDQEGVTGDRERGSTDRSYEMDQTPSTADVLYDYDSDLDVRDPADLPRDGVPGLFLKNVKADSNTSSNDPLTAEYQAIWRTTSTGNSDRRVDGATAILWISWTDNAKFGARANKRLHLDVRLVSNGKIVAQADDVEVRTDNLPGWRRVEISLTPTADNLVPANKVIDLIVTCDSSNASDDCHLGYDTYEFPSRLVVNESAP